MWQTRHLKPWILVGGGNRNRLRLKCDGTRAGTRFRLSAKRTSLFKSVGASVQSTNGSRGVPISGSNAGYTMFRGSVNSTGYQLHSPVSPSLPLPCVTVCHHVSTGLHQTFIPTSTCVWEYNSQAISKGILELFKSGFRNISSGIPPPNSCQYIVIRPWQRQD